MKTLIARTSLAVAGIALAAAAVVLLPERLAQAQAPPHFDVATIKPSEAPNPGGFLNFPGPGRLSAPNFTLQTLISFAYSAELGGIGGQVTGGPSWINQTRYNVQAQAEGTPTNPEMILMLRTLLADRFALKVHVESKERDVYSLVLARSDKKLGPKVTPWSGKCGDREPPPAQPGSTGPRCSAFFRPPGMFMRGVSMATMANMLSTPVANLGRPVVDRTGLTGEFDFDFEFTFTPAGPNAAPAQADPLAPSLFTALQEQLGLKLETAKGPVKVLVVDSAERPTEN